MEKKGRARMEEKGRKCQPSRSKKRADDGDDGRREQEALCAKPSFFFFPFFLSFLLFLRIIRTSQLPLTLSASAHFAWPSLACLFNE